MQFSSLYAFSSVCALWIRQWTLIEITSQIACHDFMMCVALSISLIWSFCGESSMGQNNWKNRHSITEYYVESINCMKNFKSL